MGLLGPILAVVQKDLLLELRNREIILALLVFSGIVLIIFNFAVDLTTYNAGGVGPGVLWVAITFASVIGLNRSFLIEKEGGALEGLMLTPVGRDTLLAGKVLSNFIFITIAEAATVPAFAVLFNVNVLRPEMLVVGFIAAAGLASAGTLFSAITINTRGREIMLPLLFLPIIAPLLIALVEATVEIVDGNSWSGASQWLKIGAGFDVIFIVISMAAFQFILED